MKIIFLDLETTGLNHEKDSILEIGIRVVDDADLKAGKPWADTLKPDGSNQFHMVFWQPRAILDDLLPVVREMHSKSGLLSKCSVSRDPIERAEPKIVKFLIANGIMPGEGLLAGSSIWFDRRFIAHDLPGIEVMLGHRLLDVSSFRVTCEAIRPEAYKLYRMKFGEPAHEVMKDIEASYNDLFAYMAMLKADPGPDAKLLMPGAAVGNGLPAFQGQRP